MSEKFSRRDFIKGASLLLGVEALPSWLLKLSESERYSVKQLLEYLVAHEGDLLAAGYEGWREDLLDMGDFESGLNLAYSYLESSGIDAYDFFIEKGLFEEE